MARTVTLTVRDPNRDVDAFLELSQLAGELGRRYGGVSVHATPDEEYKTYETEGTSKSTMKIFEEILSEHALVAHGVESILEDLKEAGLVIREKFETD